jgi:hypothetical protein
MTFQKQDGAFAVVRVASVIAVEEMRPDLAQVACADRLIAHHTAGLPTRRPAIHQDESHVASPNAGQSPVFDGWWAFGG